MSLYSIQYARALAALMVVLYHVGHADYAHRYAGNWLSAGVDIFFVISGFIMYWTTVGRTVTPWTFLRRRLMRIVPLYWLVTSVMVGLLVLAPRLVRSGAFDPAHVLASYFFVPWLHPVENYPFPVVIPGWTLNYEMFFYVAFATCLALPAQIRLWALAVVLGGLVLVGQVFDPQQVQLRFYSSSLFLEFLLGIGVGILVQRGRLMDGRLAAFLAPMMLLAIWLLDASPLRGLSWGLPAAVFIYALISLEREGRMPRVALCLLLGNASYSLYLIHPMVLSALDQIIARVGVTVTGPLPELGLTSAIVAVAALAGCVCYWLVERPLGWVVHRVFEAQPKALSAVSETICPTGGSLSPSKTSVPSRS